VAYGEKPMQEQVFWQDMWPVRGLRWSSLFLNDCSAREGLILEQFLKNCSLWEGPVLEQGESVRSKEWQTGTVMY